MAAIEVHSCGDSAVELVFKVCKPDKYKLCMKRDKADSKCKAYVKMPGGLVAHGSMTTMKAIARIKHSELLGKNAIEEAEVIQWMEYCLININPCINDKTEMKDLIKLLNLFLVEKIFFVGYSLTLADLLIFSSLQDVYGKLTCEEKEKYINVSRWFLEVQNICSDNSRNEVSFSRNLLY